MTKAHDILHHVFKKLEAKSNELTAFSSNRSGLGSSYSYASFERTETRLQTELGLLNKLHTEIKQLSERKVAVTS